MHYTNKMKMTLFEDLDRIFEHMLSENRHAASVCGCHSAAESCGLPAAESGAETVRMDAICDDKNNEIKLVAEMPGVEREDIRVAVDGADVSVEAAGAKRRYRSGARLNRPVSGDARASYRNGILEIVLGLESGPKGREVKVD